MTTQYEEFKHPNALTDNGTVPVFEGHPGGFE